MGLDFVDVGGGSAGVGAEIVEYGVDLAPKVSVRALLVRAAFVRGMGLISFDNVAGINPKDSHEVAWAELEKGEEAERLSSGHRLSAWDSPLDNGDSEWVGGGQCQTGSCRPV